jgi:glutathione peroxidase-family protein
VIGGEEPGLKQEIAQFWRVNYSTIFPVFAKTSVAGCALK